MESKYELILEQKLFQIYAVSSQYLFSMNFLKIPGICLNFLLVIFTEFSKARIQHLLTISSMPGGLFKC